MNLSNRDVIYKNINGVEYLQFRKLLEYSNMITHAYCIGVDRNFRTGRSKGQVLTDEEYDKAVKDYKDICDVLNLNYNNIIKTKQAHTDNITCVNLKEVVGPDFDSYDKTDGLATDKPDLVLSTTNADCILILFFDPVKKVIANVHSGWKGTLQRISVKAVQKMQKEYGCNPKDIIACMCPSIRKYHFEVDKDVYQLFSKEFENIDRFNDIIEKNGEKWNIDTILINRVILKEIGLLEENIIDSGLCSVCNKKYMHSFRSEGDKYGLNTAIISLKEEV